MLIKIPPSCRVYISFVFIRSVKHPDERPASKLIGEIKKVLTCLGRRSTGINNNIRSVLLKS